MCSEFCRYTHIHQFQGTGSNFIFLLLLVACNIVCVSVIIASCVIFVELSLCRHLLSEGMGADAACKTFDAEKITLEKFRAMEQSLIRNDKLVVRISGRYFPWDVAAPVVRGMVSFREEQLFEHQGMIKVERVEPSTTQGGSWRIWPFSFKRTRTINSIQRVCESTAASTLSIPVRESDGERNKPSAKMMERKVRSLTPTSEELASLHLREGRNIVTFTLSTAMLGTQQVSCHSFIITLDLPMQFLILPAFSTGRCSHIFMGMECTHCHIRC